MTAQEKAERIKMLTTVAKAFPSYTANEETLALYAVVLGELSMDELRAALMKCLRASKFFPSVAEILEAADSVKAEANNKRKPTAGEAWEEAMRNVRGLGVYKPWEYSCTEVERACKQFGIHELCMTEEKDVGIARAQFMKIYQGVIARHKEVETDQKVLISIGAKAQSLLDKVVCALPQVEKAV